MELTLKHYNNVFFEQYIILYCMYASKTKKFMSVSIKNEPNKQYFYYSNPQVVADAMNELIQGAKAFNDNCTHIDIHKMVVFINETALPYLPDSDYLEYIIYDDLLPNYSKIIPSYDSSIARCMLDTVAEQIEFYVDKIGLSNFPRSEYATKSGLARRYLGAVYPDIDDSGSGIQHDIVAADYAVPQHLDHRNPEIHGHDRPLDRRSFPARIFVCRAERHAHRQRCRLPLLRGPEFHAPDPAEPRELFPRFRSGSCQCLPGNCG